MAKNGYKMGIITFIYNIYIRKISISGKNPFLLTTRDKLRLRYKSSAAITTYLNPLNVQCVFL